AGAQAATAMPLGVPRRATAPIGVAPAKFLLSSANSSTPHLKHLTLPATHLSARCAEGCDVSFPIGVSGAILYAFVLVLPTTYVGHRLPGFGGLRKRILYRTLWKLL